MLTHGWLCWFQGVVEKNWQGVIFLMLDVLEDFGFSYARSVEVTHLYCCLMMTLLMLLCKCVN